MEYMVEKYVEYCKAKGLQSAPWYESGIERLVREAVPSHKEEIIARLRIRAEQHMERGEGLAAWRVSAARRICEKYL